MNKEDYETLWIRGVCEKCKGNINSGNWKLEDLCEGCQKSYTSS
jgi:hypothetical protein